MIFSFLYYAGGFSKVNSVINLKKHTRFMNMNIYKTSSIAHLLLTFIIKYFILKLLSTSLTNPRTNGHSCHMIVKLDPFPLHFSSPEPLGSLGELIAYPRSGAVVRPSVRPSICALSVKTKFYVEPP